MSIYEELVKKGWTHAHIEDAVRQFEVGGGIRAFGLVMSDQGLGEVPLLGIGYKCDFRAEEEWGVGTLIKSLCEDPRWDRRVRRGSVGNDAEQMSGRWFRKTTDRQVARLWPPVGEGVASVGMVLSDGALRRGRLVFGESLGFAAPGEKALYNRVPAYRAVFEGVKAEGRSVDRISERNYYDTWWALNVEHTQGTLGSWERVDVLMRQTKAELEAMLRKIGFEPDSPEVLAVAEVVARETGKPVAVTKFVLASALVGERGFKLPVRSPDVWPAWFHNGDSLVLRAGSGIVADVLMLLMKEAEAGWLAFGGSVGGPFGSGLSLYSARDRSAGWKDRIAKVKDFTEAAERTLEKSGVLKQMKDEGRFVFFLGSPRWRDADRGLIEYRLNASGASGGWYTVEELKLGLPWVKG